MSGGLAVLIPARDEAPRLGAVLDGVRASLPGADVVVVDGRSRDGTARVAAEWGAAVVAQEGAGGYAGALLTGYRRCLREGYQRVVQLDADGQHPPAAAPGLLRALEGANWVVASRAGTASPGPLSRRVGNALLAAAVRAAGGPAGARDVTSGYWALDARALAAFGRHLPGDVADANVRVLAARLGLILVEREVHMAERAGGRSMHDGPRAILNLGRSLRAVLREARRPLELSPRRPRPG